MPAVLVATARTFFRFDVSRIILKNGLHKFSPRQHIYKYQMNGYFAKLDLKLENVKVDQIKGDYFEGYGERFKNFYIKDLKYLENLIENKIRFQIKPSIVLITEITGNGVSPHVDEHTVAINYYLEADKSVTSFWEEKSNIKGITVPQVAEDGKLYNNNAKIYDTKDLNHACSFSAKKDECFVLNVRKIHSVFKLQPTVNRYAIRWGWEDYDYDTILNSIELLNK
jgi:hypothetical protein